MSRAGKSIETDSTCHLRERGWEVAGDGYEALLAEDVTEIVVVVVQLCEYVKNMLNPLRWTPQEGEF